MKLGNRTEEEIGIPGLIIALVGPSDTEYIEATSLYQLEENRAYGEKIPAGGEIEGQIVYRGVKKSDDKLQFTYSQTYSRVGNDEDAVINTTFDLN